MAWAGFDLGATSTKYIVFSDEGAQLAAGSRPTRDGALEELRAEFELAQHCIGLALAAPVKRGKLSGHPPNLALVPALDSYAGVLNDGAAAAWGEFCARNADAEESLFQLSVGTGLGGGLVIGGRPWEGTHGYAAEVGHMQLDLAEESLPCGCGARGCAEQYASGQWFHRQVPADASWHAHTNSDAWQAFLRALAGVLRSVENCHDPDMLVLGGGLGQLVMDHSWHELREFWLSNRYRGKPIPQLEFTVLGEFAAARGAAELARPATP